VFPSAASGASRPAPSPTGALPSEQRRPSPYGAFSDTPPPPAAAAPQPGLAAGEAEALVERQYRQAAQAGDPVAMRNLAALLGRQGRTAEAESWNKYADAVASRGAAYQRPAAYGYPPATQPAHAAPVAAVPAPGSRYGKPSYNHASIYALVCGLVGLISCGLTSIPAIIAGHIAWARVRRSRQRGLGFAITGIVLGWLMVGVWVLLLIGTFVPDDTSGA
jgi:hypothetical protein